MYSMSFDRAALENPREINSEGCAMMRAQFFSEDWPRSRKLHLFYGGTLQDSIVEVQVGGLMPALIHVRGHTLVQKQSQKSEDLLFDHQQSKKSEKSAPKKSHFFVSYRFNGNIHSNTIRIIRLQLYFLHRFDGFFVRLQDQSH